ncbi:MAG: histidine kinase [Bacteroidetes bacterium]|nr:histidine kinase [Bacteroidota bacterium]
MKPIEFSDRRIKIITHVLLWVIVFSLPYILYKSNDRPPRTLTEAEKAGFLYANLISNVFWVGMFYLNAFVLVPQLLYKRRVFSYILIVLGCFVVFIFMHMGLLRLFNPELQIWWHRGAWANLGPFLLSLAVSIAWRMWSDRVKADKLVSQTQQENLKTELSFLRSQISPHFMFNVLNNIVALVRLKSDALEPTVMKLSQLMQYMLYETNEEKVPVKTEAEYLQSYIDLQQQRVGNKVKVSTAIHLSNEWNEIEPMLLIPFVENAFKHGVGMIEDPQIDIRLLTQSNQLTFSVSNRYNPAANEVRDKTSGIGLGNVIRRLNLLYGDDHELKIVKENNWFEVSLTIKLRADVELHSSGR